MAKRIKTATPYFLILVLVAILIGFNYYSSQVKADSGTVSTQVTVGNEAPTISAVQLGTYPRGSDNITLVEDIDIEIVVSATVYDSGGCSDIQGAKAYVFVSSAAWDYGVETTCSFDYNDCYTPDFDSGNLDCVQQSCSSGTAVYDCTASASGEGGDGMWFHTSPTGTTASYSTEWWVAMVIASDAAMADAFATSSNDAPDVNLLAAIDLADTSSDALDYSSIGPGSESPSAVERGVENTGNRGTNITIAATTTLEIAAGAEEIATEQQQYNLTDFTVGDGTSLSESAAELDVALNKPTTHTAGDNDDQIFWGIAVPVGTNPGVYTGQTTYSTITD